MEPRIRLQGHLAEYDIPCFGDRPTFEKWAEGQLGHHWRQRLATSYGRLLAKNPSSEDVRRTFDSTAHTRIAQVNLASLFAALLNVGEAITRLIAGRKGVLDLGCNIGHLTTWYARADPDRHVTGVDFSSPCIHAARSKAKELSLTNVDFEVKDIGACELSGSYDTIVESQCLRYVKDTQRVLRHLASLLEPDGLLVTTDLMRGTNHGSDLNSLLRSAGLVGQHKQSANFSCLERQYGCSILVARMQTTACNPEDWLLIPAESRIPASER
jgi:2-polyprenyl-3-methyl-5-hydroxy-6-metoxy-1,4-benzoquinol methylase